MTAKGSPIREERVTDDERRRTIEVAITAENRRLISSNVYTIADSSAILCVRTPK